jgi:hypothetical protein
VFNLSGVFRSCFIFCYDWVYYLFEVFVVSFSNSFLPRKAIPNMAAPAAIHLKVDLVYSENNLSFIEPRLIRNPILNYKHPKNKKITKEEPNQSIKNKN